MLNKLLPHPECSNTSIGRLVAGLLKESDEIRTVPAYLLTSLLLAEIELADSQEKRQLLHRILASTYGDVAEWSPYAAPLSLAVQDRFEEVAYDVESYQSPKVRAYIQGIIGKDFSEIKDIPSQVIYRRQRRIFHRELPKSKNTTLKPAQIFCLLGFKASGKSTVLDVLSGRNHATLELYKELRILKGRKNSRVANLPHASLWTSEPLELVLEEKKIVNNMPERLFVGSILRQEEIDLLSEIAPVRCIAILCPNNVRHERARARGRAIEKNANEDWLVELDAHRTGEWPTYETNDVSTLIANADVTFSSTDMTADRIASEILQLL